ncbi:MAG TPA: branched-chain amino acid ABC transporter permease, partial [Xanthobacteraceae bacterium]|nr:branched-chain amino acid ABC transporter permease [Xanthobacteraceae bacterium]
DLIVLGAFLILALSTTAGLNPLLALAITLPIMFTVGYGVQSLLLNRALGSDVLPPLLITFGLSIIVQNSLLEGFSADTRRLPVGALDAASFSLGGGIAVGVMPLLCFLAALGVIVALNHLFYRTALGRAFRATSDDPSTAQLMGVDHRRVYAIALGVALVVCAIAAFFLGSRANFDPTIGPARLIYAFEAVIIGGLGSLWGTLAGGIVVGVAQTIGARINPEWQILAGHVAFLIVLVVRPRGLFPRATD